jgi:nucleotide-binding universal stress UspA family protein
MPAPLKAWPEPQNLTAYELHASGSTAESVIDFVTTELKPDLLLIGSRPRGMVSRMFTTGVSSSVVESAAVPTLVVRGDTPMPHEGVQRRIAVCLDGSSSSCRKVAEWAAATLLTPADDVYLLHSPAGLEASQLLPAMANIEASRTFLLSQGFPEHCVSPVELDFHTDARDAVIDFLEAGPKPFDICVCGSRGLKGSLTRFMLGSVTRYLLLYAPCSLLVLPPAALGDAAVVESGPA